MIIHKKIKAWLNKFKPGVTFEYNSKAVSIEKSLNLVNKMYTVSSPSNITLGKDCHKKRCYSVKVRDPDQGFITSTIIYSPTWNWSNIKIYDNTQES